MACVDNVLVWLESTALSTRRSIKHRNHKLNIKICTRSRSKTDIQNKPTWVGLLSSPGAGRTLVSGSCPTLMGIALTRHKVDSSLADQFSDPSALAHDAKTLDSLVEYDKNIDNLSLKLVSHTSSSHYDSISFLFYNLIQKSFKHKFLKISLFISVLFNIVDVLNCNVNAFGARIFTWWPFFTLSYCCRSLILMSFFDIDDFDKLQIY